MKANLRMVLNREKEKHLHTMEQFNMQEIFQMIYQMDMENIILMIFLVIIMRVNLKMENFMEKERNMSRSKHYI